MTKKWGPKIWYFFHIFSQQINEKFFLYNKVICLRLLNSICEFLPCPECSSHAIKYLKDHNFKKINSKNQLILFFFRFHNSVNQRLNKPTYLFKDLEIYKTGKIIKISNIAHQQLIKPLHNDDFLLSMYKEKSIIEMTKFIQKYQKYFKQV
jgi:hypothetical protein